MSGDTMTDPVAHSEMRIPKPRAEIVGLIFAAAFVAFFVALSVLNLVNRVAVIPSIIWLLLVTAVICAICRDEEFLRYLLGGFASTQFVERVTAETQSAEIRFGYQLFGRRCFYLRLPVGKIEAVNWTTGQVGDWHVALWFDHDDPAKHVEGSRKPDQDVYIVGPSGSKEETETFGLSLVDFLCNAGASLVRGEDECSFVRKTAQTDLNGEHPTMPCA